MGRSGKLHDRSLYRTHSRSPLRRSADNSLRCRAGPEPFVTSNRDGVPMLPSATGAKRRLSSSMTPAARNEPLIFPPPSRSSLRIPKWARSFRRTFVSPKTPRDERITVRDVLSRLSRIGRTPAPTRSIVRGASERATNRSGDASRPLRPPPSPPNPSSAHPSSSGPRGGPHPPPTSSRVDEPRRAKSEREDDIGFLLTSSSCRSRSGSALACRPPSSRRRRSRTSGSW